MIVYVFYTYYLGAFEISLTIELLGLFVGIFALILSIHLYLKSTIREDEIRWIATVVRDTFYREAILELLNHEPILHSDMLRSLEGRIPHSNRREFTHTFYIRLSELATLKLIRLEPTYFENERSWITQASFYDEDKREVFQKNRTLLREST